MTETMREAPEKLNEDILFLACTRPAAFAGAPMEAWFVIIVSTGVVFLAGGSLLYLASGFFSYAACRVICKHDPNQFSVLFAWAGTKLRCRTRAYWGASSASPLRVREPRNWRELKKQGA
jgi:type IV secretion system protein VirB3